MKLTAHRFWLVSPEPVDKNEVACMRSRLRKSGALPSLLLP